MLDNIFVKFHEDILNGFKGIERTRFCHRTANYKLHWEVTKTRVMVLAFCRSSFGA